MKKIIILFTLFLSFCFITKSDSDSNYKAAFNPVNIKGLLVAHIEKNCYEENEKDTIIVDLIPEDKNSYNGKIIEIELPKETQEKFLRKNFKNTDKLLERKIEFAIQPVNVNVSDIGVKLTCGAGFPVYYAKISNVTKLKSKKTVFLKNKNDLENKKNKAEMKKIKAIENAEIKKSPQINAQTFRKAEKGEEFNVINRYGDWYYIIYEHPVFTGYIHKNQVGAEK